MAAPSNKVNMTTNQTFQDLKKVMYAIGMIRRRIVNSNAVVKQLSDFGLFEKTNKNARFSCGKIVSFPIFIFAIMQQSTKKFSGL